MNKKNTIKNHPRSRKAASASSHPAGEVHLPEPRHASKREVNADIIRINPDQETKDRG